MNGKKIKAIIRGTTWKTVYVRIPPEIVKKLDINEDTVLECSLEGKNIIYIIKK